MFFFTLFTAYTSYQHDDAWAVSVLMNILSYDHSTEHWWLAYSLEYPIRDTQEVITNVAPGNWSHSHLLRTLNPIKE